MAINGKADCIINVPRDVEFILSTLNYNGFDAYIVGGCVRDNVMGNTPCDWDIATSALPAQTKRCFYGEKLLDTGLKHGTITLNLNNENYEITTYRVDGEYSDYRRPNEVKFTKNLKEDLSRRDFTINALAYSKKDGIIDFFGGLNDIECAVIKCVGEPKKRFSEDALRIMRALRFASTFGFKIEEKTGEAITNHAKLLKKISAERINVELVKLICGVSCGDIMRKFASVFAEIIPEVSVMFDFDQQNPHHIFDVWNHTIKAVESSKNDPIVRIALLLHDIGKPATFSKDAFGVGHFYGHQEVGVQKADTILRRLRFDNKTIKTILMLIKYHDLPLKNDEISAKKLLNKIGEKNALYLIEVKRGDMLGQNQVHITERIFELDEFCEILHQVIEQSQCFSPDSLAINGDDIMDLGIAQGERIGEILRMLTDMVIEEKIENDKMSLAQYVVKHFN